MCYGADKNESYYWIIRNQWGTDWGDKGYIYVSMSTPGGLDYTWQNQLNGDPRDTFPQIYSINPEVVNPSMQSPGYSGPYPNNQYYDSNS